MGADPDFLSQLQFRVIDETVDLSQFDCHAEVDWYLRSCALEHHRKRITSVVCAVYDGRLAGFIATAMSSVEVDAVNQRQELGLSGISFKKDGKHAHFFPSLLIGMLGVSREFRRRGIAQKLVKTAIGQARALSAEVGCRFVTVDSDKTDGAVAFYKSLGFKEVTQKKPRQTTIWMYFDLGPLDAAPAADSS